MLIAMGCFSKDFGALARSRIKYIWSTVLEIVDRHQPDSKDTNLQIMIVTEQLEALLECLRGVKLV
jgi:hypothetical protein